MDKSQLSAYPEQQYKPKNNVIMSHLDLPVILLNFPFG